ncbi:family 43 glycosylhydrolase [Streptomyces canus]|uniref:family 43 glycosylhydrolase n=1 Tax=Streptomyces canus TaxID=58343 RepID=UPI0039A61106
MSPSPASYAPSLRHHDGRFWPIVTNVSSDGNMLFTATDPAGPWSDPVRLPGVPGIDPDLAWDEDGTAWCAVAGVSQVRLDPYTEGLSESRTRSGPAPPTRWPLSTSASPVNAPPWRPPPTVDRERSCASLAWTPAAVISSNSTPSVLAYGASA